MTNTNTNTNTILAKAIEAAKAESIVEDKTIRIWDVDCDALCELLAVQCDGESAPSECVRWFWGEDWRTGEQWNIEVEVLHLCAVCGVHYIALPLWQCAACEATDGEMINFR